MTQHDQELASAAERHVWPSQWLDWDCPTDPNEWAPDSDWEPDNSWLNQENDHGYL
jgi:hypothetical protein